MMWGKAYDFHRHSGRMTQDSSMRMTNKAEVGMGLVSVIGFILFLAMLLALIGVI